MCAKKISTNQKQAEYLKIAKDIEIFSTNQKQAHTFQKNNNNIKPFNSKKCLNY